MQRVIAYIDGFNLYFGLKASRWRRYYWLDVVALSRSLMLPNQTLLAVKYFTAKISSPRDKVARQLAYLDALSCLPACSIVLGRYQEMPIQCPVCRVKRRQPMEKMTDVNIALNLLSDAIEDNFDTALLVSGDADLVPVVSKVFELFPGKRIVCGFPPKRGSKHLATSVSAHFTIGRGKIAAAQLPPKVVSSDGTRSVSRPLRWA